MILLGQVEKTLIELTERILNTEKQSGLKVNANKLKYMILQRSELLDQENIQLKLGAYWFKRVRKFNYFGLFLA